jgi:hypothetical protein
MSDLSLFIHGKLTPEEFIAKAAADIKKDTAWFAALPFAKSLELWIIDRIYDRLVTVMSPTLAAIICHQIKVILGIQDPIPAAPGG